MSKIKTSPRDISKDARWQDRRAGAFREHAQDEKVTAYFKRRGVSPRDRGKKKV